MAKAPDFKYAPMFQLGEDKTEYRLISKEGVSTAEFEGKTILKVSKEALTLLAQQGFHDVEFMLRREHNAQVAKILTDPEASENDKYVALQFLRNAETAVKGILPFCQDTGTAIIHGEKGQRVWTDFEDEEALSLGVYNTYTQDNLRYSQNAPLNMYGIEEIQNAQFAKDKRTVEIMNYIQSNYLSVTLEGLSDKFYLSKPYLSKYIKEKSGMTFGELVKNVRLKKAKTLLKTSSMTVESIALSVGYQNVEHFNRLFKKAFNMTPVQFRNKK